MRPGLLAATALSVLGVTSAAAGCLPGDAGTAMTPPAHSSIRGALRTSPSPITVGAPFAVDLRICGAPNDRIERLLVDATMPAHRHGMNYKPEVTDLGEGRYRATGLLFHMPGRWEFVVTIQAGRGPTRLTLDVNVR